MCYYVHVSEHIGYFPPGESIGEQLRQHRLKQRRSQADVAAHLAMLPTALSRIEHNHRNSRISTLADIARELGLEIMLVPKRVAPAVRAMLSDDPQDGARFG